MNRRQDEQLNNVKHYLRDGDFWRDFWRLWTPIAAVVALAIATCWSDIISMFQ